MITVHVPTTATQPEAPMPEHPQPSPAPQHRLVGRVLSRFYDVQLDDPIHIIADYDPAIPDGGELMSKAHEAIGGPGLTITAHGCQHPGSIWLNWPDVPVLIAALQQALRDAPNEELTHD